MILLCQKCKPKSDVEILTVSVFDRPCSVCGSRDEVSAYRLEDPKELLERLLDEVDSICEWLDYYPTLSDLEEDLRKLNGTRLRYLAANQRLKKNELRKA